MLQHWGEKLRKIKIIGEERSCYACHSYFAGIYAPYEKCCLYPDRDGLGDYADVLGFSEQQRRGIVPKRS
jgi:hypothetical protein